MAIQPEHDDGLVRLAYTVRELVGAGNYAKMQSLLEDEAERRGLTPWELTHKLAEIGFAKGIAQPIQMVPEGELVE